MNVWNKQGESENPSFLHMVDAELFLFWKIGRLRKQHEQMGETKRQSWSLYRASPTISKLVRWSPRPKDVSDVELWLFISTDCQNLNGTSITCRENMRKQHQHWARPSGVHIPRNRPAPHLHQRQGEVILHFATHHALGGRILIMKAPTASEYFNSILGFCLEHVPCVRAGLASHV
jgi:hypothetical protein